MSGLPPGPDAPRPPPFPAPSREEYLMFVQAELIIPPPLPPWGTGSEALPAPGSALSTYRRHWDDLPAPHPNLGPRPTESPFGPYPFTSDITFYVARPTPLPPLPQPQLPIPHHSYHYQYHDQHHIELLLQPPLVVIASTPLQAAAFEDAFDAVVEAAAVEDAV